MKFALSALALVFASQAHALEFSLSCSDMITEKPLPMKVVKAPRKTTTGKWENLYFVETLSGGKLVRVPLLPAGSGDEDYNDYRTPREAHAMGLQGGAIQNRFKWATVSNTEGSTFADCR